MFDVNEILARLQDGDSAEDLAAEMSKALNAAEAKFQEAKEQAEKAKAQEQKEKDLNDLAEIMLDATKQYMELKYPEVAETGEFDMTVAEFRGMMDDAVEAVFGLRSMFGEMINEFLAPTPVKAPKSEPKAPQKLKTADDKIADFLKSMGW